ncbi:DUF599 domain-containing protein [Sulfurivermis fontis]|uniref:DUF599 domain-containing protein n=1 Tax=Sulfurivermis fontis TaxID=1972068 RepID=UPI000FDBE4E1|nr:DUF599 domain-containing protein [Sulfurivermis fontis]
MNTASIYNDLFGLAGSTLSLLIYHLYLRSRLRQNPHYTVQAVNRYARTQWVQAVMANDGQLILGVQTLRNSTMAATLMASTAVLLIIGTLNLSGEADKLLDTWHLPNLGGSHAAWLWMIKLLFLVTDFFIAFFAFSMSVRLYNHVGFKISVPPEVRTPELAPDSVAVHLNRAGYYYSIGMRTYYFAVPLVFWLFSPILMLGATLVLIGVMYHIDRSPKLSPFPAKGIAN